MLIFVVRGRDGLLGAWFCLILAFAPFPPQFAFQSFTIPVAVEEEEEEEEKQVTKVMVEEEAEWS